jgi:misacylated tRNA(Ala) deacylase
MNLDPGFSVSSKDYSLPMHTAEHILNQTMVRMFGCKRSQNAHIEKKKSKCDYFLDAAPTEAQVKEIEQRVNAMIETCMPVVIRMVEIEEASKLADLSKLPEGTEGTIRLVYVGDYDICACIGAHVENTSEIGIFKILNHEFEQGRWRMRFKLEERCA